MATIDPYFVSLQTAIAGSSLMGHFLEDRRPVRDAQDDELTAILRERTRVPLANRAQRNLFACAPVDLLVSQEGARRQYHLIELNGTGIGGLSNMPGSVVAPILETLRTTASTVVQDPSPVFLLAVSGKESDEKPRLNKLMHEKLLFAEALKQGLQARGGDAMVFALPQVLAGHAQFDAGSPAVVVGYMKDLIGAMTLRPDGRLAMRGRPISGILNDRFCLNVLDTFGHRVDLGALATVNRCFIPGADKGVVYSLLNDHLPTEPCPFMPPKVEFETVQSREELIDAVIRWVRSGRQVVIKPHATGVGHGIEFFLAQDESEAEIVKRIEASIRLTVSHYRAEAGGFPYTVCRFVDTCSISREGHPLHRHKYELRVVVYQDDGVLHSFPSIVKVASRPYARGEVDKRSLINNVTAATEEGKHGVDFMLPLTNRDTLALLGIPFDELCEVSAAVARFTARVVSTVQREPERFGLPLDDFQGRIHSS